MDLETRETGDADPERERGKTTENEPDLPPEYCHYRDEGCEFADSCLNCPFPKCLYDEPRGRQRWRKELRNREIDRLFSEGWSVKELAMMLGLSPRTIQRALKSTLTVSSSKKGGNWRREKKLNEGELKVDE